MIVYKINDCALVTLSEKKGAGLNKQAPTSLERLFFFRYAPAS